MVSMIERVGRALAKEEGYAYDPLPYDARARAAIEAMREPTEAIIKAHHLVPEDNDFDQRAADNWRNLIDAALKAK